ncbi:MAG: hypothetical protein Q9221_002983 [Calogaya cf. arnoldii]
MWMVPAPSDKAHSTLVRRQVPLPNKDYYTPLESRKNTVYRSAGRPHHNLESPKTTERRRNKPPRLRDDPKYLAEVEMGLPIDLGVRLKRMTSMTLTACRSTTMISTPRMTLLPCDPRASDDNPRDGLDSDHQESFVGTLTGTGRPLRSAYNRLSKSAQEAYDQDQIYLKQLLSLSHDYHYTVAGLENEDTHERALSLLYRARLGQEHDISSISPHIQYNHLPKSICDAIKKRIQVRDSEVLYETQMAKYKAPTKASGDPPGEGTKK